jgi:hypothetical protein
MHHIANEEERQPVVCDPDIVVGSCIIRDGRTFLHHIALVMEVITLLINSN